MPAIVQSRNAFTQIQQPITIFGPHCIWNVHISFDYLTIEYTKLFKSNRVHCASRHRLRSSRATSLGAFISIFHSFERRTTAPPRREQQTLFTVSLISWRRRLSQSHNARAQEPARQIQRADYHIVLRRLRRQVR